MKTFARQYSSRYVSVSKARHDVASFARDCGLSPNDVSDITLAAGEACNNAVEHGHVANGRFQVKCSYSDGRMTIEVADRGKGFNPAGKGEWREPETLGIRGLGIFIMRSLMDEVSFLAAQGTSVRLVKCGLHSIGEQPSIAAGVSGDGAAFAGLPALHDRLKSLLKLGHTQTSGRRQS